MHFDSSRKIQQIRLYWDQGSLLKLVDVIGARARAWPIRDGKDQARLIASSALATSNNDPTPPTARNGQTNDNKQSELAARPSSRKKSDPRGTLALFEQREEKRVTSYEGPTVAPRTSARPEERNYHDLFVGNDSDYSPASKDRSVSPTKEDGAMASKGGSGKNYQPSRLFNSSESQMSEPSQEAYIRPHPTKFSHFELSDKDAGNSALSQNQPLTTRPNPKSNAQWKFEDFSTPEKVPQKPRPRDVRHFGFSDDDANVPSPDKRPHAAHPRRDAETTLKLEDDGRMPSGDRRPAGPPRGQLASGRSGLYQNNIYDDTELSKSPDKKLHPLSTVHNVQQHRKDLDPHFSMTDSSPSGKPTPTLVNRGKDKENQRARRDPFQGINTGIKTGGDGMGGKKGTGRRWGFGDESDEDGEGGANGGKFQASKIQQKPKDDSFWGY